jgi:hypothetical protein
MSFLIAPVITQSLTNYFFASNSVVKQQTKRDLRLAASKGP